MINLKIHLNLNFTDEDDIKMKVRDLICCGFWNQPKESFEKPIPASGEVVFYRDLNGKNIKKWLIINVGNHLQFDVWTPNGQYFVPVIDKTSEFWSEENQAYMLPPGRDVMDVKYKAFTNYYDAWASQGFDKHFTEKECCGENGNIKVKDINSAFNITIHNGAIPQTFRVPQGCDGFYNPEPFTNGKDATLEVNNSLTMRK